MLNKDQRQAIELFKICRTEFFDSLDGLAAVFGGYREYLDNDDFEGAKLYIEDMPDCSRKVLITKNILDAELAEEVGNENNF